MFKNLKTIGLLISIGLLTLTLILSGTNLLASSQEDQKQIRWLDGSMRVVTPEVIENNNQLIKASTRLTVATMSIEDFNKYIKSGIPLPLPKETVETLKSTLSHLPIAGHHIDPFTGTIHVGLKELREEFTEKIKKILEDLDNVKVEFFNTRYAEKELKEFQGKIEKVFWGIDFKDMKRLYEIKDEVLRERVRKEYNERMEKVKAEKKLPLTLVGVDIINSGLIIGLKSIKP